jgi:hypothetical protein
MREKKKGMFPKEDHRKNECSMIRNRKEEMFTEEETERMNVQ